MTKKFLNFLDLILILIDCIIAFYKIVSLGKKKYRYS